MKQVKNKCLRLKQGEKGTLEKNLNYWIDL